MIGLDLISTLRSAGNFQLLRSVIVWFLHIPVCQLNNTLFLCTSFQHHFHTLFKQVKSEGSTLNMEQLWHDSPLNNECKNEHSAQLSVNSFGFWYVNASLMSKRKKDEQIDFHHTHTYKQLAWSLFVHVKLKHTFNFISNCMINYKTFFFFYK